MILILLPLHSGLKLYVIDAFISYKKPLSQERGSERSERASEWVSAAEGASEVSGRANEWAQRRARAKRAVRSKWTSGRYKGMSEQRSQWPSTQCVWIIRHTAHRGLEQSMTVSPCITLFTFCKNICFSAQPSCSFLAILLTFSSIHNWK